MLDPRRWPWWGWVVAVVLLLAIGLFSTLFVYRQQGLRELAVLRRALEARHLGIVPADFIARAPTVDRSRQTRLWALIGSPGLPWADIRAQLDGLDARCEASRDMAQRDRECQRVSIAATADLAAWRALRQEGPLYWTQFGWAAEDFPHPEQVGVHSVNAGNRTLVLLHIRALATAFANEARIATDPRPELAELDALVEAGRPSSLLIDSMILMSIQAIRDSAWLEACTRGIDPAPWVAARVPCLDAIAHGFVGERLLYNGSLYQDALAGRSLTGMLAPTLLTSGASPWWEAPATWCQERLAWATSPGDAAFAIRSNLAAEETCRSGIDSTGPFARAASDPWFRILHPMAGYTVSSLECAITGVQADTGARRLRIAGALAALWRNTGSLPSSSTDAGFPASHLLAAQDHGPEILYQRISRSRFRLWTDPTIPPTDLLPVGRIVPLKPSSGPWNRNQWALELDLGALPPPAVPEP